MTPKKELMFDPQWLDMNYEKYYFVPWPDCQIYADMDIDCDDPGIVYVGGGMFVSQKWIYDKIDDNEDGSKYS